MRSLPILISLVLIIGCQPTTKESEAEWEMWRSNRIENLKSLWGYMNLAGLYWLEEGENSIGSDSSNAIIFPEKARPFIGKIIKEDTLVWFETELDDIKIDSLALQSAFIYGSEEGTKSITQDSFLWMIIKRGERLGIRLIDTEHPKLSRDPDIQYFNYNPTLIFNAKYTPYPFPKKIQISDVIGTQYTQIVEGQLEFEYEGDTYTLEPFREGDKFFLIFSDETSAITTYGSGRYMYCKVPGPGETTVLDFNKSYNPPCAFTDFATCPIPPPENRLNLVIDAGELDFHF